MTEFALLSDARRGTASVSRFATTTVGDHFFARGAKEGDIPFFGM
ncbi:hypothetical protein [Nocardia tengchongensis]|nr:hypothetical protein [Nocardia tengchongensis]